MRIPDPFFRVINPVVRILLRSPLHWLLSRSLLLLTVVGRRSGRTFVIPVRYMQQGATVRFVTERSNQWWRNMLGGARVRLTLAGVERDYVATAIADDPERVARFLRVLFEHYPQDAAYHDLRLDSGRQPEPEELMDAARRTILIEAEPGESERSDGRT